MLNGLKSLLRQIQRGMATVLMVMLTTVQAGSALATSTFASGHGIVTTDFFGSTTDEGRSVVVQTDGKILVGGKSGGRLALARYNIDGSLDTTFGGNGKVLGSVYGDLSIALQADGKILAAGGTSDASVSGDFALARYNANGELDAGFGSLGLVTTSFGIWKDTARSVTVQVNGKILVAGRTDSGSVSNFDYDFALARYNTDGRLDTSFGTGGKVVTPFGSLRTDWGNSVTVQQDGKILVGGSSGQDFALARYNADGSLDSGFGTNGRLITIVGNFSSGESVQLQQDGKILLAGDSGSLDFVLVRYNTDGNLDTSFGVAGKVTTNFGSFEFAYSAAVQADGKIVVVGTSGASPQTVFALARYTTGGSLDTTFGNGGKVTTAFNSSYGNAWSVALQNDGKILVAGSSHNVLDSDFALVRYKIDGSLDTSTQVVEFYNTILDNYFITANAVEGAAIDSGSAGPGWTRTGTFNAGGDTAVCRFYGSQSPGPNSHFYTVDSLECQALKDQQFPAGDPRRLTIKSWNFESLDFISTPVSSNGTCPNGLVPVYRAYNNGFARGVDSNHRITSNLAAIQEVVNRGWKNEGVVMCAPG